MRKVFQDFKVCMLTWLFALCCPLVVIQCQVVQQVLQDLLWGPWYHHVPVRHNRVSGRVLLDRRQWAAAAPFLLSLCPLVVYVAKVGDVKGGHGHRLCPAGAVTAALLGALLVVLVLLLLHQGGMQQPALLLPQVRGLWPRSHPCRVPVPSHRQRCRGYCCMPLLPIRPSIHLQLLQPWSPLLSIPQGIPVCSRLRKLLNELKAASRALPHSPMLLTYMCLM